MGFLPRGWWWWWWWTLRALTIISNVTAWSGGNFPEACETMMPIHTFMEEDLQPQNSEAPFERQAIANGKLITVTLQSKPPLSAGFKGFMLEARNDGRPVGRFILLDSGEARTLKCGDLPDSAVSQRRNNLKQVIKVNWTSEEDHLNVIFKVTFLQNFDTFWRPVNFTATPPTEPPTEPSTQPSTEPSTKPPTTPQPTTLTPENAKYDNQFITTMNVALILELLKMEGTKTVTWAFSNTVLSYFVSKWTRIVCSVLGLVLEISTLVLVRLEDSFNVVLIGLGSVMAVTGLIELVIFSQKIGRSHELKDICDHVIDVLSIFREVFAIAFIFVAVVGINDNTKNARKSWLPFVLISYTAWIALHIVFICAVKIQKATVARRKIGTRNTPVWDKQRKQKSVTAFMTLSMFFTFGSIAFSVAIVVGIFQS